MIEKSSADGYKLAAILVADTVAYTLLIQADEAGTLDRVKRDRAEIVDPLIARFRGRLFKTTGDGFLAEFGSVVDAVACASEIQRRYSKRNEGVPAERRLELRIGVHHGDVIDTDGDLHGESVIVASRLEPLADPDGILLSEDAYHQVRTKLPLAFDDLGPRKLKNIAQKMRVYRVRLDLPGGTIASTRPSPMAFAVAGAVAALSIFGWIFVVGFSRAPTPLFPKREVAATPAAVPLQTVPAATGQTEFRPVLVVLPFGNLSNDPEQEYFNDGITEDITTALSRIPGFLVTGRNSAFQYKGKAADPKEITRDLGVRYMLQGSVRKDGDRLRLNAQLIDTATETVVWAEKYDRPLADVFVVQDELADRIIGIVASHLRRREGEKALSASKEKLDAYELIMRARILQRSSERDSVIEARQLVLRAIDVEPTNAQAYVVLARVIGNFFNQRWNDEYASPATAEKQQAAAARAVSIAPEDAGARAVLAQAHTLLKQYDQAVAEAERALSLGPNDTEVITYAASVSLRVGQFERTVELMRRAMVLDPFLSVAFLGNTLGQAYYQLGRYSEAAEAQTQCVQRAPTNTVCRANLAASLAQLNRPAEARAAADELQRISPGFTVSEDSRRLLIFFRQAGWAEHLADGLRKAGVPE